MKIAIVTQALLDNYGGVLQNFALQQTLKNFRYNVETIDFLPMTNFYREFLRVFFSWLKTIYLFLVKKIHRPFAKFHQPQKRKSFFCDFIFENIMVTESTTKYDVNVLRENHYDIVLVGSDQVWRPNMNLCIEDMFLGFAKNMPVKRISYAASFGVDEWEYTPKQTKVCSALAKKFNAISVREESGVKLCKEHLGVDATWVLDPTLLLKKEDYLKLCQEIPVNSSRFMAVYVLNLNDSVKTTYESIAKEKNLEVKYFAADANATLSIPEWLAMFRDASYVVTDSFHGTVFSIIFEKEFKCIYNETRGAARFESLLNLYNSGKLEEMRVFSLNWLKNALES